MHKSETTNNFVPLTVNGLSDHIV